MHRNGISVTVQGNTVFTNNSIFHFCLLLLSVKLLVFFGVMLLLHLVITICCYCCHLPTESISVYIWPFSVFRLRPFYLQFMHWPVFIKISLAWCLSFILLTLQSLINFNVHLWGFNGEHLLLPFKGAESIKWKLFAVVCWYANIYNL